MSVEQTNVIDLLVVDKDGNLLLTIVDDSEWDDDGEHAYLLQEKLKRYLAFVESGELASKYPEMKNRF